MKKVLFFLLLFICISLSCVYGYLLVTNNKISKQTENTKTRTNEVIEQSKNEENVINDKKQSLADEKEKYADLYKEYELWQKMNQKVLENI